MKIVNLLLICVMCVCLTGCLGDLLFGTDEEGNDKEGRSPAEMIGDAANFVFPGSSAAVLLLTNFWSHLRGKRYKKAAAVTFGTLEKYMGGMSAKERDALKDLLDREHASNNVGPTVKALLAAVRK